MRHIELADGLRVRFPARGDEFDEGVEIGLVAASIALGRTTFTRRLARRSVAQARAIAEALGYRVTTEAAGPDWVDLGFSSGRAQPKLKLVHSC